MVGWKGAEGKGRFGTRTLDQSQAIRYVQQPPAAKRKVLPMCPVCPKVGNLLGSNMGILAERTRGRNPAAPEDAESSVPEEAKNATTSHGNLRAKWPPRMAETWSQVPYIYVQEANM